jgi:hypothetical protein
MIFPKLIDGLISLYGWRGAYLALAGLVALTILPVAAALFRDRPEKFGLSTDAGLPPAAEDPRRSLRLRASSAAHQRVLAAVRGGLLTNAIGTALAQSLLNHADSRDRTQRRATAAVGSAAFRLLPRWAPDFWWIAMNLGIWFRLRC